MAEGSKELVRVVLTILLLFHLFIGTHAAVTKDVVITASPASFYDGLTRQLTINCSFLTGPGSDFSDVMSIIVSRTRPPGYTLHSELALLSPKATDTVEVKDTSTGALVAGHLGNDGLAFLSLKWNFPNDTVQGDYQCQVFGMDHSGHPKASMSVVRVTAEQGLSQTMLLKELKELHATQDKLQTELTNLKQHAASELNDTMSAFISNTSSFGGHKYLLSKPTLRDITKSASLCRLFGGYLVEIDTQAEYDFVWDFAIVKNKVLYLTLGATDLDKEGDWRFIQSNKPVVFRKNGDGLTGGVANNCMELWKSYNGYVDEPCYGTNHGGYVEGQFLCEIDM